MTEINGKQDFKYNICVSKQRKFVKVIKSWKSWDNDDDYDDDMMQESKNEYECKYDDYHFDEKEEKYPNRIASILEQLKCDLRKNKLLHVASICEEYDEDCSLEFLLEFTKNDLLELINEINADDSNDHKISVVKKNKFAKIICKYAKKISDEGSEDDHKLKSKPKNDVDVRWLQMYQQLLRYGFDEELTMKAAQLYPDDLNRALDTLVSDK
eukprot:80754_1